MVFKVWCVFSLFLGSVFAAVPNAKHLDFTNAKIAKILPALNISQNFFSLEKVVQEAIINDYADNLLKELDNYLISQGVDPLPMPGDGIEINIWPFKGELSIKNGKLTGLGTLARSGNVKVQYEYPYIGFDFPITFKQLKFTYNYQATINGIGFRGLMRGSTNDPKLSIVLKLDGTIIRASLDDYNFKDIGHLTLQFEGGIAEFFLNFLVGFAIPFVKPLLQFVVDGFIEDGLSSIIDMLNDLLIQILGEPQGVLAAVPNAKHLDFTDAKIAKILPALNISQNFFSLEKVVQEAIINDYADTLLEELDNYLISQGVDPLPMPDQVAEFEFLFFNGELSLKNGKLSGLGTLARLDNIKVQYEYPYIWLDFPITFKQLKFNYEYRVLFMSMGLKGVMHGSTNNPKLSIALKVDGTIIRASLDDYNFKDVGHLTLQFEGGIAEFFFNFLVGFAIPFVKPIIKLVVDIFIGAGLKSIIDIFNDLLMQLLGEPQGAVMPEAVASTTSFDPTTNANAEDQNLPEERKTKFLDKGVEVYIQSHFRSKATTTELITTMDNATSTNTVIVKSVTTSPITVKQLLIPDLDVTRTTMDTSSSVSQISINSFYTDQNDSTESDDIDEIYRDINND
ncbi:hypothetical protein FQA39_LY06796 [Lamprigera yunnana]|nr:hypothetical protein FQA39_LY06796 [Lamprigera yunnana]